MNRLVLFILPLSILALWSVATLSGLIDELFLPPPWEVASSVVSGLFSGRLAHDLFVTVARSLAPADGITPAEISVVSSGLSWSSRLLTGEGTIVSTDQGLMVLSSTPGSVVLEISSPGA